VNYSIYNKKGRSRCGSKHHCRHVLLARSPCGRRRNRDYDHSGHVSSCHAGESGHYNRITSCETSTYPWVYTVRNWKWSWIRGWMLRAKILAQGQTTKALSTTARTIPTKNLDHVSFFGVWLLCGSCRQNIASDSAGGQTQYSRTCDLA
jgi:hypothetical protein